MRTVVLLGVLAATGVVEAQGVPEELAEAADMPPTLLLRTGNPQSVPARQLYDAVRLRMGHWRVQVAQPIRGATTAQRVADAQMDLETHDAVVWAEMGRTERLVLLMRVDGRPRAIPIRRTHPRWAERAARYVDAFAASFIAPRYVLEASEADGSRSCPATDGRFGSKGSCRSVRGTDARTTGGAKLASAGRACVSGDG